MKNGNTSSIPRERNCLIGRGREAKDSFTPHHPALVLGNLVASPPRLLRHPDFIKLLEMVNDGRLKVNLDMANVPRDTTVQLAKLVGKRVVHTHVSELLEGKHGIVIGKGDVDFKGAFRALKDVGYDSWISLEALTGDKEDLRFSINHIRNVWNSA